MGVQKSRASKRRKNLRRSEWLKISVPGFGECPQCHQPKMPHRVCPECGYYKEREVVKTAEK